VLCNRLIVSVAVVVVMLFCHWRACRRSRSRWLLITAVRTPRVRIRLQKFRQQRNRCADARVAVSVTASETATIDLGRFGFFGLGSTPDQAQEIETAGLRHDLDRRFTAG